MTKEEKRIELAVEAAFRKCGNGVQVGIFDIGKIMRAGEQAAAVGGDIETAMSAAFTKYGRNQGGKEAQCV
jgi:hypothetical protein